jgi:protein Mpv17
MCAALEEEEEEEEKENIIIIITIMNLSRMLYASRRLKNVANVYMRSIKKALPYIKQAKKNIFTKHLIITNLLISSTFSGLGDIIEQMFEMISDKEEDCCGGENNEWNKKRTLKLATTGITVGLVCHVWYINLDKHFYASNFKTIVQKILLSQLIFSPISIVVFFVTLGILNSSPNSVVVKNIKEKGKQIYIAEWAVWPLAFLINFYLVPLKYRILYDSVISLGFDVFNSYIVHKEFRKPTSIKPTDEQSKTDNK